MFAPIDSACRQPSHTSPCSWWENESSSLLHPVRMQVNLTWWLNEHGLRVIAKRVARLMRVMWPQATMPGPHTSRPHPQHPICRYLLRGMETQGPYEVWSTDITYIPMRRAFIYLVAVMDWFSRYVIAWDLSNTIDAGFCVVALSKLLRTGRPASSAPTWAASSRARSSPVRCSGPTFR